MPVDVNLPAVNDFMSFGYVPHPETLYKNIFHVEPGSFIAHTPKNFTQKNYWVFEFKDERRFDEEYYTTQFITLLNKAVKKRIDVDVPKGAFLSGGIDSSGICCIMNQLMDEKLKAFTLGFKEEKYSELAEARLVAKHLGLDLTQEILSPNNFNSLLEKIIYYYDMPFEDTSAFPSFYLANKTAESIKVVLTGDGPDQFIAGSYHHKMMQNQILTDRLYQKIIRHSGIKHLFQKLNIQASSDNLFSKLKRRLYIESLGFNERVFYPRKTPLLLRRHLFTNSLLKISKEFDAARNILPKLKRVQHRNPIEQFLYFDIYFYMHDDLIQKVERACSAHSLDCRSPYRDKELIAFIETLPLDLRLKGLETKYIVKKAFKDMLPETIIYKKKQGFAIPRDEWFVSDFQSDIKDILLDKRSLERGYFKEKQLKNILNNYFLGKTSYYSGSSSLITSLLTLELWHRIFIDK